MTRAIAIIDLLDQTTRPGAFGLGVVCAAVLAALALLWREL